MEIVRLPNENEEKFIFRIGQLKDQGLISESWDEIADIINTEFKLPETCDELLKEAGGESKIDGKPREGLVFRDLNGENSFKAVDNEFIVKYHSN